MSLNKFIALSIAAATSVYAAAYKIPEQSLNGTALGAAYVANANGADASYYNPANMVFSSNDNELEIGLSYITASEIDFASDSGSINESSEKENVIIPTFHYIIPSSIENTKFGISLVAPAGLSKKWNGAFGKAYSEEFTLKIVELNPTIGYKINDKLAIGGGLRLVYSEGVVKNQGTATVFGTPTPFKRDLEADAIDYGYNLAITYKATKDTVLAATYRSFVDIEVEGSGTLSHEFPGNSYSYDGDASIKFPLPAALNLAIAHTFGNLTAEFVYEKTYWSELKEIDLNYSTALDDGSTKGKVADGLFDAPHAKNWKDTDSYKLGLTYKANDSLTLMGSYGIDESPAPADTLSFELPDTDAKIYSLGFNYKLNKTSSFGAAYLISVKDDVAVNIGTGAGDVAGEFSNSSVSLLTLGYTHQF